MEKLQFAFKFEASPSDKKTSIVIITSITTQSNIKYVLSETDKLASNHTELIKTENYKRLKKSLTRRGQEKKIWITCSGKMRETYFDEDGNIMFDDTYLEQIEEEKNTREPTQKKESQLNLKNISERFMIEKFICKHQNAKQWLQTFETECHRFEIYEDSTKIEILRLYLDKSCLDWHSATITTLTIEAPWSEWRDKFLETFADKGWNAGIYAISYRFKEGSLMEYAMRKEKLLLDMDDVITTRTLVMLIAAGLPEYVRNKIDKEKCENTTELLHEIRKCENLVHKNTFIKRKEEKQVNKKNFEEKKPCTNCEKLSKGIRFHPESSCWFKRKNENEQRTIASNSVIEVNLNSEQKNE